MDEKRNSEIDKDKIDDLQNQLSELLISYKMEA